MKRKPASLEAGFYSSASDTKCLLPLVNTPVSILLCQCVNQARLVRTAPSGRQVVALSRGKAVASDGDVVEVGRIAFPQTQRVNSWVNEAGRFIAVGFRLLISQSQVAGPHGRGKTGPAIKVFRASGLVGADVKGKIRVCRDVRAVAIFRGSLVGLGDHSFKFLPTRNRELVGRDAAATVDPNGFRTPAFACALGDEVRAADADD